MGYLGITAILFIGIWLCFCLMLFHYGVFALIGMFRKRTYPRTQRQLRYAIIIAARNEERVIGSLLDSIRMQNYPQHLLTTFVVAHNCDDRTAEIARKRGAVVYPYNNPKERTAGFAYRYLFRQIQRDYGQDTFDGFFVINADNILSPDYVARMNDAFVATEGKHVITSYRNSQNFGANYMSCMYGIFFLSACRFEARGRTVCDVSTRVSGTGYLFHPRVVENGWEYVTLTEDWEFTADQIARGNKVLYCDDAIFYDEQPTTVPVMFRQRLRWACGHMIVFFTRFKALMQTLRSKDPRLDRKCKFSAYDIAASIMPLGVIGVLLQLATLLAIGLCPLFGYNGALVWHWYGVIALALFALSWVLTSVFGGVLLLLERKRIPKLSPGKVTVALLLWPMFLLVNVFLDVAALFLPNLEWKTIPHVGEVSEPKKYVPQAETTPPAA